MTTKLQHAINETRNGNKVKAQKLLADLLKEETDNVQAWYLLSLLVDSEEKKEAYLSRVLTLDPEHEKAQELLLTLEGDGEITATDLDLAVDTELDEADDKKLPSWLEEEAEKVPESLLIEEDPSEIFNDNLPDWLSGENAAMEVQEEPPTLLTEDQPPELAEMLQEKVESQDNEQPAAYQPHSVTTPTEMTIKPDKSALRRWNFILFLLWSLAILILIVLLLQIFNIF